MATLYISEFPGLDGRAIVEVLPMPPIGNNAAAIAVSPGTTVVLSKSTKMIRVQADSVCSIKISKGPVATAPVATATDMRIPANAPGEYFAVVPGSSVNVVVNT